MPSFLRSSGGGPRRSLIKDCEEMVEATTDYIRVRLEAEQSADEGQFLHDGL